MSYLDFCYGSTWKFKYQLRPFWLKEANSGTNYWMKREPTDRNWPRLGQRLQNVAGLNRFTLNLTVDFAKSYAADEACDIFWKDGMPHIFPPKFTRTRKVRSAYQNGCLDSNRENIGWCESEVGPFTSFDGFHYLMLSYVVGPAAIFLVNITRHAYLPNL